MPPTSRSCAPGDEIAELARERDEAGARQRLPGDAKDDLLELISLEFNLPLRSAKGGAIAELERRIQTQARRLDDLLGQARVASAELCQSLHTIAPAVGDEIRRHLLAGSAAGASGAEAS